MAFLDPIDRVQPRSRTTCVGWWARSKGTDAIHCKVFWMYHAVVEVDEQSVESEESSSQGWPCPSSTGFPEADYSVLWTRNLPCLFLSDPCLLLLCPLIKNHWLNPFSDEAMWNPPFRWSLSFPFLPFSFGPPGTIFFWPPFMIHALVLHQGTLFLFFLSPPWPLLLPLLFNCSFRTLNGLHCQAYSLLSHVQKHIFHLQRNLVLRLHFICGPLPKFIFINSSMKEGPACTDCRVHFNRSEGFFNRTFRRTEQSPQILSLLRQMYKQWQSSLGEKSELVSLSLGISLRSLATANINVVKLSLNGNRISWFVTCVPCHWSLIAWV